MSIVNGTIYNDSLYGGEGEDYIYGQQGNDTLSGGGGQDYMDGGAGVDTVDYSYWNGGGTYNLATGVASFPGFYNEQILNFESIITGGGNDNIIGNDLDNRIEGGDGNDTLSGGGGQDYMDGGVGIDTVDYSYWNGGGTYNLATGVASFPSFYNEQILNFESIITGGGNDNVIGNGLSNRIETGSGNDTLSGGSGNDTLIGGTGYDTADYSTLGQPITLFARGIVSKNGLGSDQMNSIERIIGATGQANTIDGTGSGGSTYFNINMAANQMAVNAIPIVGNLTFAVENFANVIGTNNADTIVGNSAANLLNGAGGNDSLIGGLGNDSLVGGDGSDRLNGYGTTRTNDSQFDKLTGGAGSDYFVLGGAWGVSYVETGDGYAVIQDWNQVNDWIEVKGKINQYDLKYTSVGGIGSSAKDTEIYFTDAFGNRDRIGIVQDSTNVKLNADFKFVA